MCHFEEQWILSNNVRPSIWFRYVDDAFTLFDSKDRAAQFLSFRVLKFAVSLADRVTKPKRGSGNESVTSEGPNTILLKLVSCS